MKRNSTERLGGEFVLDSRGFAFSYTASQRQHINFTSIYKYDIMLILKGVVFLCMIPCTAVVLYNT